MSARERAVTFTGEPPDTVPSKAPNKEIPLLCILPVACFALQPSSEDQPAEKTIRCEVYIPEELAPSSLCLVLMGGRV